MHPDEIRPMSLADIQDIAWNNRCTISRVVVNEEGEVLEVEGLNQHFRKWVLHNVPGQPILTMTIEGEADPNV